MSPRQFVAVLAGVALRRYAAHPMTALDIVRQIATLTALRKLSRAAFVADAAFLLGQVVSTTLAAQYYTHLALTLWCSLPLVAITVIGLMVMHLREFLVGRLTELRAELEAITP